MSDFALSHPNTVCNCPYAGGHESATRCRARARQQMRRCMMELEPAAPSFNSFLTRAAQCRLTEKATPDRGLSRLILGLGTGAIFASFTLTAFASPLSKASFNQLASSCAPGVAIPTLRAVAAVESHFDPLAIRDNTTHESWTPSSLSAAAALAKDRLKLGHSVDIGLMQINSGNLASLRYGGGRRV